MPTEIYGMIQLGKNHKVPEEFVEHDHRGKEFINFDGCNIPNWRLNLKKEDIVGFGEDEIGDEAHILVIPDKRIFPDEIVLDNLKAVRNWFTFDGVD